MLLRLWNFVARVVLRRSDRFLVEIVDGDRVIARAEGKDAGDALIDEFFVPPVDRSVQAADEPANIRVVRDVDGQYVVIAAEVDGRTLYATQDANTPNDPGSFVFFETERAAIASYLMSHPWRPEEAVPEACAVCDANTLEALAFEGTPEFVLTSLIQLGVAEESARTIVQEGARLDGLEFGQAPPFSMCLGITLCARCADKAGLDVAAIGSKIPTYVSGG